MEDNRNNNTILSPQDALISIMIAEGASDQGVTNVEFASIVKIVEHLPIFKDYDVSQILNCVQVALFGSGSPLSNGSPPSSALHLFLKSSFLAESFPILPFKISIDLRRRLLSS